MGFFQTLANAFDAKDAKKSFIDSGSIFSSGRFIALAAVVALAIFKICEPSTLTTLLWAFGIYTAGNTVTRAAQIVMDGLIHKAAHEAEAKQSLPTQP
jgi:hypothetical protein